MKYNNIDWIIEPKDEKGGLAIANIRYFEENNLENDRVTAVVSVYGQKELDLPDTIKHLRILINDSPKQDISHFFPTTFNYIQNNMNIGNTVVHCHAGVSRSASIVIAYLIRKRRMSYQDAFNLAKQKRPVCYPNRGFTKQLKKYAQQVQKIPIQKENNKCLIF